MKKNQALGELVKLSRHLDYSSQHLLLTVEDGLAKENTVSIVKRLDPDIKRYLSLTSLPFSLGKPKVKIDELWAGCNKCQLKEKGHFPTGNLNPRFFVVGDAPAPNSNSRMWADGVESHLLRMTLLKAGIYYDCWFTNLIRCETPGGRLSLLSERVECKNRLEQEIEALKPSALIVLGEFVASSIRLVASDLPVVKIEHPLLAIKSGKMKEAYFEEVRGGIKKWLN
jgi:uracil-DNA glycosylase family 4